MRAANSNTPHTPMAARASLSAIAGQISDLVQLKGGASPEMIEFHLKAIVPALPPLDQWRIDREITVKATKELPLNVNRTRKKTKQGYKYYYYHRLTKRRLPDDPTSPEFMLRYAREQAQCAASPETDTIPILVSRYMTSPEYQKLAASTKRCYEKHISNFAAAFTDLPVSALEDPRIRNDILNWRDQFSEHHRTADLAAASVSAMIGWAVDRNIINFHAMKGVKKLHTSDRADIIWEQDILTRFVKLAPKHIAAVVMFAAYTGQRQSDVVDLRWNHITADNHIKLKLSKGGKRHSFRIHKALQPWIESIPKPDPNKTRHYNGTILINSINGSWTAAGFRSSYNKFLALASATDAELQKYAFDHSISMERAEECRQLAMDVRAEDLHFHDLRGTAVTKLADAGASNAEIAGVTGHSLETIDKILKKYMKPTIQQGDAGISKWEALEEDDFHCAYGDD